MPFLFMQLICGSRESDGDGKREEMRDAGRSRTVSGVGRYAHVSRDSMRWCASYGGGQGEGGKSVVNPAHRDWKLTEQSFIRWLDAVASPVTKGRCYAGSEGCNKGA